MDAWEFSDDFDASERFDFPAKAGSAEQPDHVPQPAVDAIRGRSPSDETGPR
jgi:hypothetical protein